MAIKTKMGLDQGLNIILCIGENYMEYKDELTFKVCQDTLNAVKSITLYWKVIPSILDKLTKPQWKKLVINYLPIWAIGAGKTASPDQVQKVHEMIREWIADYIDSDTAETIRITYGGSINEANYEHFVKQKDVDGLMVDFPILLHEFKVHFIK